MTALDEFTDIVSGIYAGVMTPERWDECMAAVGRAFGAHTAALVVSDRAARVMKHAQMPTAAAQSYQAHYARLDHVLSAVESGPLRAVRTGAELMWPYQRREFQAEWARPNGLEDGLFVRLTGGSSVTTLAIATVKRSERFDNSERIALINRLVPHFQQALRMRAHLDELEIRSADCLEASEWVRHGIVITAPDRRVVSCNSAAERILSSTDGLRIRNGRIEADLPHVDTQLQRSLQEALTLNGSDTWGGSFPCARPSGRRPYVIHVAPIDQTTFASPRSGRASIVIVDPEHQPEPPAGLLQRLYGLTKTEARIALLVARGQGLKPLADELSVSITTVRTHLQHIFDKTGTSRQAELVRLVLTVDPR
ncbi:DNA-binding protein with HTH domain [Mycolicibacterium chubuense NBB4]|uniref:DNA-binding protein with HTH domain n=1 Tax=Mycolicibacterium chubuense (strain NBB4) TaxID=710421 RepID=I4BQT9_MYCCN|nr:helix-turn-helix transcriptional regulator [Mycolicibacterium chubuense]AFM19646.1 DNA-binding protein with HTH domain [Mycolicibacterium chubuense NBB4]